MEEAAGSATARRVIQVMARRVARWEAEARAVLGGGGAAEGAAPPAAAAPPPPLELWSRPYEAAKADLVATERRLLVALGFILAVGLAWDFDIGPQGIERTLPTGQTQPQPVVDTTPPVAAPPSSGTVGAGRRRSRS